MSFSSRFLLALAVLLGATAVSAEPAGSSPPTTDSSSLKRTWNFSPEPASPPAQERSHKSVWDILRDRSALQSVYGLATLESPGLKHGGSIVVSFTITPDGQVTDTQLVSSSFNSPLLEGRILQRVGLIRFEEGNFLLKHVPSYTVTLYLPGHAPRTLEEVQLGFDRNKLAFTDLYKEAQAQWPALSQGGKIIVSLKIDPDGGMKESTLVSSTFGNPGFEAQILELVRSMHHDARAVPAFIYPNYPIVLYPLK